MIVIDASIALAWSHKEERTDEVQEIARQVSRNGAVVPAHWPVEIANGLEMAVRRKRVSVAERDELLANFKRLVIQMEPPLKDMTWSSAVWLAHRLQLTVYDATYLELALRLKLPLATLYQELIAAARSEGVPVLP